ncbi:MAG: phosphoribosylanthranilate isomerase [Lachnospiraceae bacterium]|nr:phosphoribosylanthranilate isomerase [Lachnospiraceae bacterium]
MTKIKICGLFRECDIDYVNEAKPDYAGFILNYPKSHRNVPPGTAQELKNRLSPEIKAVGVFVNQPEETVIQTAQFVGLDIIQLHGNEDNDYINHLKEHVNIPIWKAFKVKTESALKEALQSTADEILLDNGYGTGECFDWSMVKDFNRPFILAGGLTPENIPEAIRSLKPLALDISSGVETQKVKDRGKIIAAVRSCHSN